MTKRTEKIKARLAANPLHYGGETGFGCICERCIKERNDAAVKVLPTHKAPKPGKRVPLYAITNYGDTFAKCDVCGENFGRW